MILIIDDERTFDVREGYEHEFMYARTSDEGILALSKHWIAHSLRFAPPISELWLDHDLGENDTIMPVVEYLYVTGMKSGIVNNLDLIRPPDFIQNIYIHSQNPTAADRIIRQLGPLYANVQRMPLPELKS